MMACTCIGMVILPSYEEIGFTATVFITLLRGLQGISSATEVTGAELYITEMVKPPVQYPAVALITLFGTLGVLW